MNTLLNSLIKSSINLFGQKSSQQGGYIDNSLIIQKEDSKPIGKYSIPPRFRNNLKGGSHIKSQFSSKNYAEQKFKKYEAHKEKLRKTYNV